MSGTFILIVVIAVIILLGKHAITEGQRVEQNKKFMKNLKDFDKKYKTK
jgi:hypothetical protein